MKRRTVTSFIAVAAITVLSLVSVPQANAVTGGSISGTVFLNGAPAKSVVVVAQQTVYDSTPAFVDATGQFTISGLAPGDYVLHISDSDQTFVSQYYNGKSTFATADRLTVTDGNVTQADPIVLEPRATVSGDLTLPNAPHGNIMVSFTDLVNPNSGGYAYADPSGHFVVHALRLSTYSVQFTDLSNQLATQWYHTSLVGPGDPVDITSTTQVLDTVALEPSGSVDGFVVGTNDLPVADAEIAAYSEADNFQPGPFTRMGLADSQGYFTIEGLNPGTYKLDVPVGIHGFKPGWYGGDSVATAKTITIVSGQSAPTVQVTLAPDLWIDGTVTGPGGNLEQVSVEAYDFNGEYSGSAVTDSSGAFSIRSLAPSTYTLKFSDPYNHRWATLWYGQSTVNGTPKKVKLTDKSLVLDQQVLQHSGSLVGTIKSTVSGVTPDLEVDAYVNGTLWATGVSSTTGAYTIKDLGTGTYTIRVYGEPKFRSQWYRGRANIASADFLSVTAGHATRAATVSLLAIGKPLPKTTPAHVLSVKASKSAGKIKVTWSKPASDGGAAIKSYSARLFRSATSTSIAVKCTSTAKPGKAIPLTCTTPKVGKGTYYVTVVATNSYGTSTEALRVKLTV